MGGWDCVVVVELELDESVQPLMFKCRLNRHLVG